MKKVVFICSANKDRSKTAQIYFETHFPKMQFSSAGTNTELCLATGSQPIQKRILEEADQIFVMELKHEKHIKTLLAEPQHGKIEILHIPDIYQFGDQTLIIQLKERVTHLL